MLLHKVYLWLILLVLIAGLYVANSKLLTNVFQPPIPEIASGSVCDPMQEARKVKALENWVFNHSTKIPRAQAKLIVQSCLDTKLPLLMLALACHESQGFDPTAVSKAGALGLTQVMPKFHEKSLIEKGIIKETRDLFDISINIRAGHSILQEFLTKTKGDVPNALGLYLGDKDKWYTLRVLSLLADLYYLVEMTK